VLELELGQAEQPLVQQELHALRRFAKQVADWQTEAQGAVQVRSLLATRRQGPCS